MKQALVMSGNSYVGRHVVERFIESAEYEVRITQDNSYNAVERGVSKTVSRYSHNVKEFTEGVLHSDVVIALVSNDDDCAEAHAALKILTNTCYDVEKTFVLVSSLITWSKTVNKALKSLKEHRVQERNRAIAEFRAEYGEDEELPSELQLSAEPDVNKNENVVSNGNKITVPTEQEKNEDKVDVEDKDEEMQNIIHRTYTEEDYKERACPDEYVTWRKLERYAKQVNSQTLHSYVIFAGVAYGVEQTPIVQDYMMRAFAEYKVHVSTTKHQVGEVNPPNQNSNRDINIKNKTQNNSCSEQSYQIMSEIEQKCIYYGTNYLPMIHVRDLASICFVLGNSYDVLEERYFFAIDSGTCSVQQLLYALNKSLRGDVAAVKFTALAKYSAAFAHQQRENNYTTCEFHNNMNYEIINNATTITTTTTVKKATTFPSVLSHAEQETNRYATDVIADHYTDNDDDDCHKKVDTFTNNTEKYYLMRDMMLTRRHTHIDASSLSILNYFPESKWHCYDGWMANFDRVLYEFQQSMQLKPNRVMFIGPPCSGVELIATKLADKYNVPLLTEKSVIHNFITHRDSVRAELKSLLLTRLLRRRAKAHWKRVRGEWKERKRIELEKLQARRERRAERRRAEKEKNADDEEEEEEEEEDSIDEEDEEDEEEEGIEEDEEEGDEKNVKKKNDKNTKSKTLPSSPYLIIDVNEVERASVKITEDYLLGPLHNRGRTDNNINNIDESYNYEYEHNVSEDDHDDSSMDDFAADEEMEEEEQQQHSTLEFEEEEEEEEEDELMEELRLEADKSNDNKDKLFLNNVYNDVLPPPDWETLTCASTVNNMIKKANQQVAVINKNYTRAQIKKATMERDNAERIRITELRHTYNLMCTALSMKLINGKWPRPLQQKRHRMHQHHEEEEEQPEEEENEKHMNGYATTPEKFDKSEEQSDENDENEEAEEIDSDDADENENNLDSMNNNKSGNEDEVQEPPINANTNNKAAFFNENHKNLQNYMDESSCEYLDEALAFFFRWQMQQPCVRFHGYVMINFPRTVRQACYLFHTTSTRHGHHNSNEPYQVTMPEQREPLHLPASVEEVVLPNDVDFPFPPFLFMKENERCTWEHLLAHARPHLCEHNKIHLALEGLNSVNLINNNISNANDNNMNHQSRYKNSYANSSFYHNTVNHENNIMEFTTGVNVGSAGRNNKGNAALHDLNENKSSNNVNTESVPFLPIVLHQTDSREVISTLLHFAAKYSTNTNMTDAHITYNNNNNKNENGEHEDEEENEEVNLEHVKTTVLAPVDEALFPHHVLVFDDSDVSLKTTNNYVLQQLHRALIKWTCDHESEVVLEQENANKSVEDVKDWTPLVQLCALINMYSNFDGDLQYYRVHHEFPQVCPSHSLLTWFETVSTTEVCGAPANYIRTGENQEEEEVNDKEDSDISDDDVYDDDDDELYKNKKTQNKLNELQSTVRTAHVSLHQAPLRSTQHINSAIHDYCACLEKLHSTVDTNNSSNNDDNNKSKSDNSSNDKLLCLISDSQADAILETLHEKTFCTLPNSHAIAQTNSSTSKHASLDLSCMLNNEANQLHELKNVEQILHQHSSHEMDLAIQQERRALRAIQVAEGCLVSLPSSHSSSTDNTPEKPINTTSSTMTNNDRNLINAENFTALSTEKYLMTYVLPSLTPLIAEVTALRPDDPVNVLADLLFKHQRRTTL